MCTSCLDWNLGWGWDFACACSTVDDMVISMQTAKMILKDTGLYRRKSESDPLEGYVDASCTISAASKQGMLWPGITRYEGGVRGLGGGLSSQGIHYLSTQNFWPYIFWQSVRTIHVNQQRKSQDGNSKQEKVADIQYSLLYFLYMLELPWVDSVCAFDSRRTNEICSHWTLDFFLGLARLHHLNGKCINQGNKSFNVPWSSSFLLPSWH